MVWISPYPNLVAPSSSVIILVADGVRPDTLLGAMRDDTLPALARLKREGTFNTVTTVFPSVTGPAYTPFLMGKHPGKVGLPGLRWYDRSRTACSWPSHARSYVGVGMRHVDGDIDGASRTMFELAPSSVAALSVIRRGVRERDRIGNGLAFAGRTAMTHFRGDVHGWLDIDRQIGDELVRRVREEKPAFVFAAFTGIDKASHAKGHESTVVREAMGIVDDVACRIREDAECGGYWDSMHLWVVSDHGHSPVRQHDDLAAEITALGYRVLAHPWAVTRNPNIALMVSGNAMAHVYLDPGERGRRFWHPLEASLPIGTWTRSIDKRWNALADTLLQRASVDVMLLPRSLWACEVRGRGRGMALVTWGTRGYTYRPETGDPLGIGTLDGLDATDAYDATLGSDYPDALVQIMALCECSRSGDIILSAARDWDFRARYEPIPHVSAHGALHREHMLVPLLTNHPTRRVPRRTVDVMPSAAAVLGIAPGRVDGTPFL
jgi:hypothetical protein